MAPDMRSPSRKKKNSASSMRAPLTTLSSSVARDGAGLARDLGGDVAGGPEQQLGEVEVQGVDHGRGEAVEQESRPGGLQLVDQVVQLAALDQLLDPVVGPGRLADQQRAEQDRRDDGQDEDQEHQDRGRDRARAAEQPDQPRGQGVEGEGQDRGPRQWPEERRKEEEELVEEQPEHDEEERRKEPLTRHGVDCSDRWCPVQGDVSP